MTLEVVQRVLSNITRLTWPGHEYEKSAVNLEEVIFLVTHSCHTIFFEDYIGEDSYGLHQFLFGS